MTASPLSRAVDAFLAERRKLGLTRPYLYANAQALRELHETLEARQRPLEPSAVTEADLLATLDAVRGRGLSPSTLRAFTCVYRRFFRWLLGAGKILIDPASRLQARPVPRQLGYVPTLADVDALLHACDTGTPEGLRERAIVEVLYGSGLRISEVASLDVRDVDLCERTAFVKDGKGRKDRVVPLTVPAAAALARYLAEGRPSSRHPALFLSARVHGRRLCLRSWYGAYLRPLLRRAGLQRELTPHRLRHACAVHLLERGASVRQIQRLLGHASILATQVYLALDASSLHAVLARAHPREQRPRGAAREA